MPIPEATEQWVEIAVQAFGPGRVEQLMGREYKVYPAVLVRSQVLQNNLGRTFLPPEEITEEWANGLNGAPVIVDHPSKMGQPISARDPEILNARGIGFLFSGHAGAGADGVQEVRADVWLEVARSAQVAELGVIMAKLDKGESPEISTGFPLRALEETPGVHNAKPYDRVLRPAGWDHLAVFADQKKGACGVKDGCKLNVNHDGECAVETSPTEVQLAIFEPADAGNTPQEGNKMTRDEMVAHLAERGPLCKAELEKLSDNGLTVLCEAAPAVNAEGPDDMAILQRRNLELRRENEQIKASTALAQQAQAEERLQMVEELVYHGNTKFSEAAINAMDLPTLRNLYGTVFQRPDYSARGGPSVSNAGPSFAFVEDTLGRKEAN